MRDTVARNHHLGLELTEDGMNTISAQLHQKRPDLFEVRDEIPIHPQSGRKLILYAFISEPIAFNFQPVGNGVPENGLFLRAKVEFSLTDEMPDGSGLGLITSISAEIEAIMQLDAKASADEQRLVIGLLDARFLNFSSNHPSVSSGSNLSVDLGDAASGVSSDPSFIAILNYLITVFLRSGLEKPIEDFPFPPLNLAVDASVAVYLRGARIWGDTLGVYLHRHAGSVLLPTGSMPAKTSQLAIGIVEPTINEIIGASLPVRSPVEATPDHKFFSIRETSWIEIKRDTVGIPTNVDLIPPHTIRATLFFNADLKAQINVKLGKYWVRPKFTLPIRDPSFIRGAFTPFTKEKSDHFQVLFRPEPNFFRDPAAIVLALDYYTYFRDRVREWLKENVSPILKKIPIIGWIVAKSVEVIVSELVAVFVGGALSVVVSTFLTILLTALYNVGKIFFADDMAFVVYKLKKTLPGADVPLELATLGDPSIASNQGGELVLDAWFEDQGVVVPAPPIPSAPDDPPEPGPVAGPGDLPMYAPGDFLPPVDVGAPAWAALAELKYDVLVTVSGIKTRFTQELAFAADTGAQTLSLEVRQTDAAGMPIAGVTRLTIGAVDGRLIREIETSTAAAIDGAVVVRLDLAYDEPGNATHVTAAIGTVFSEELDVVLPEQRSLVPAGPWMFLLMSDLPVGTRGKLCRLDVRLGEDYTNWARPIPQTFEVAGEEDFSHGIGVIRVRRFRISDEVISSGEVLVEVAAPHRVFWCRQESEGVISEMTLTV